MGEVWRARDSKLRREVAIKTLPAELARDPDRLARLEREATSLAAVNHPNIAAIYGLEEHASERFLVLELVEGDTLADRFRSGSMSVEQSLEIALQVAEALEAAHERGVIHRDLKPANIKVTPEGRVKVLDFGLAKALPPIAADTLTQATFRTELGAVIGTAPYMSPEQTRGEAVRRQTDIWSFGVVLYELLTGDSPFERRTTPETIARVLVAQPDFAALPKTTPANVRHLLRHCLEKDQKRRLQHIGDARIELEDALAALAAGPAPQSAEAATRNWQRRAAGILALAVALGGFSVWSIVERETPSVTTEVVRLSIPSLPTPSVWPFGVRHLAISEDGSRVAYAGEKAQLSIRRLRDRQAITLPTLAGNPFFSPDGEWLGYFGEPEGLWKVPSIGGQSRRIAAITERASGASWGPDSTIVFATTSGLYQIADDGSASPRLLAAPNPERDEKLYAWPQFMPDGKSVLFTIVPEDSVVGAQIVLLDLQTLETRTVLTGGTAARYTSTGHLVYAVGETLAAIPLDGETRTTRGEPTPLPGITIATTQDNGAAEFAISATGTLIHIEPRPAAANRLQRLVWLDREGNEDALALEPGSYRYPRVSPDGTRLALDVGGTNRDVWIWDLRRSSLTRLTNGPTEDMLPLWTLDGRRVFFSSDRTGNFDIYSQPADGSTEAKVELARPEFDAPNSFSPDGTQLIVFEEFRDLGVLDLAQSNLRPLLHRESSDRLGEISPDGNWIAYESDESGEQIEIFVRPFPDVSGAREKVSIDGGRYPRWGLPGSGELYYVDLDGAMMAATVDLAPSLRVGSVTKLFDWLMPESGISGRPYDISPIDGRFIMAKPAAQSTGDTVQISVVLNWFNELTERVPLR
jgi:serine/threonine-protein kinase